MAKFRPISKDIGKGFPGKIIFRKWKDLWRACAWQKHYRVSKSEAALFNWTVWQAACREYKLLKPSVVDAYKLLAGGTGFTWRDLFNSQYMLEYYKNRVEPCVVRDFSYTKTGPRIVIAYELSKEFLHSVTRHSIARYDVKIPGMIGKHSPGCPNPPDPDPDAEEWQCEMKGSVDFTESPEFGAGKLTVAPENEYGYDWTWDWLLAHWPEATWKIEAGTDSVAWYAALGEWPPIFTGSIRGRKCTLIIHLTQPYLHVSPTDVTKAWIWCEGSLLNFYISGFKCVETGDLVPIQAGPIAFGNLLPYIGKANQWFHMQPIEQPDPPTKPIPLEAPGESWSGGEVRASSFKCHFCYEQKVTIPFESLGVTEFKYADIQRVGATWDLAWEYALEDWYTATWRPQPAWEWANIGQGSVNAPTQWYGKIWTFRKPIIYRIGNYMSAADFAKVKWGRIMMPRTLNKLLQLPGGTLRASIYPSKWTDQIHPTTEILIPKACLTYPNTTLLLECGKPRDSNLKPEQPIIGHNTYRGYEGPPNPNPPLVLYKKGDRSHIVTPPWNFESPYWLKFSQQDEFEPIVSPFFRIT